MKLPDFSDIGKMMGQARKMQEEMQQEMQQIRVQATAGGGMVNVTMNGAKEMLEIRIDPDAVKNGDAEMLQDMVLAAVNEAARKADEAVKGKLSSKLGGMGLPPGLF